MIERAVESWLTKTNERNYQLPLTQVLIRNGHSPLYISAHRPMEQGKDIITRDHSGVHHAYQLKTGDIDLTSFRRMRPEIVELIELPIVHPSAGNTKRHRPYLVTNGQIADEVRHQIELMNRDNERRGFPSLQVIEGPALLAMFLDAQGSFLPMSLEDFRAFLELFGADGRELPDKNKYFAFLNGVVFQRVSGQPADKRNLILASVVLMSYVTDSLQRSRNHYGLYEAWTCLAASLARFSHRAGLDRAKMAESMDIVEAAIVEHLEDLKDEAMQRTDFLEGDTQGDGSNLYRARATIVLGALSLLEMYKMSQQKGYVGDPHLWDFIFRNGGSSWFWGESAWPFFYWFFRLIEKASPELGRVFLEALLQGVAKNNAPRSTHAFASPYWSATDVLESIQGLAYEPIEFDSFAGSSFVLESVVQMCARRSAREVLERHWRGISHIRFRDFQPEPDEDFFSWRAANGVQITRIPSSTQSWQLLLKEAEASVAPAVYADFADILPFVAMVLPHRMRASTVGLFDRSF